MKLRRQPCAAFCAAALQDEAAGLRRHTGTEAVRACALDLAGLICAFHNLSRCPLQGPKIWSKTGPCLAVLQEGRQGYADAQTVSIEQCKPWVFSRSGPVDNRIWRDHRIRYRLPRRSSCNCVSAPQAPPRGLSCLLNRRFGTSAFASCRRSCRNSNSIRGYGPCRPWMTAACCVSSRPIAS